MTRDEKILRLKESLQVATGPLRRHAAATRDSLYETMADAVDNAVLSLAADVLADDVDEQKRGTRK